MLMQGFLVGAKINIPCHDYWNQPYHITHADVEFDAKVAWVDELVEDDEFVCDLVTRWAEIGPEFNGIQLDNDDAIVYAQMGAKIIVVRNKDGIYQRRMGRIDAVSKSGYDVDACNELMAKVFSAVPPPAGP